MSCAAIVLIAQGGDDWAAVGDELQMQQGLGGGNPEDIEARKQAAEQAVQEQSLQEYWEGKEAQQQQGP